MEYMRGNGVATIERVTRPLITPNEQHSSLEVKVVERPVVEVRHAVERVRLTQLSEVA